MNDMEAVPISSRLQLAVEHHQAGRVSQAEEIYRQILQAMPSHPDALHLSGVIAQQRGSIDSAVQLIRRAIEENPFISNYHLSLGNALQAKGVLDEAVVSYQRAITLKPDYADAYNNLGAVLKLLGRLAEAAASYQHAIQIKPDCAEAYSNLGNVLRMQGRLEEAVASHQHAISLNPDFVYAYCNLGNALRDQGRLDDAIALYRQAISISPDCSDAYSSLIFALDLKEGVDALTLLNVRRQWGDACAAPLFGNPAFPNLADPERRLRIGYVSCDFREHSAAIGFGAMLTQYDQDAFEVFAYTNAPTEDRYTHLFQQRVTCWRKIADRSDDDVANMIRQDGIDILVDLSGHTNGNRLLVFARKPAPIQVTAWGYNGGSGMKAMDFFFTDRVIVPPEEQRFFVEKVRYLPSVICAFFPDPFPAINSLPALMAPGITFGSLNRLAKVSAEVINAWAQVLQAIPTSRRLLKTGELDDVCIRERIAGQFICAGIDPSRIILQGKTSWRDHMATFNQVDMALDTFPATGGVTTLEGLMMGVPVVTLRGTTFIGRGSSSLLTTLGLTDWIAESLDEYVELAVQKAGDVQKLGELRGQLRTRFMTSIIGDTTAYVRVAEEEYRKLWREWCVRSDNRKEVPS